MAEEGWLEGNKPNSSHYASQPSDGFPVPCGLSEEDVLRKENPLFEDRGHQAQQFIARNVDALSNHPAEQRLFGRCGVPDPSNCLVGM